jgi:hypothetical protein
LFFLFTDVDVVVGAGEEAIMTLNAHGDSSAQYFQN